MAASMSGKNKQKRKYTARTKDHITPISKDGNGLHANTVFACALCNSSRGNGLLPPHLARKALYIRLAAIAYQLAK